jgi:outer membrane protein OmpA-like peptidoglycan-associated protein
MEKKTSRKTESSENETDEADQSSDPTREAVNNQSKGTNSPISNVGDVNRSESAKVSVVGRQSSEKTGGSYSSSGKYVNYERHSDPRALSARYGMNVRETEAAKIQRFERVFGRDQVSRWADEGMTVDTMAKPRDMQAFRKRQEERPDEVPTDIERRNEASMQRNANGGRDDGPAGETGVPDVVRNVVSSPGRSMDETVQREMESKMGGNFSDVQLHTGPKAAAAADSINARAFTVGNHIAFNKGEYQPKSTDGKKTLAHELTHVRQQTDGAVSLLPQVDADRPSTAITARGSVHIQPKLKLSSPDDPAEKEAEWVAKQVVEMDIPPETEEDEHETQQSPELDTGFADAAARSSTDRELHPTAEKTVQKGVRGSGRPLAAETRERFESKMGADFSDVRVHTDPVADFAARSINAEAFTIGSNIAFTKGSYNPDSPTGGELLAHELTHVLQQSDDVSRSDQPVRRQSTGGADSEDRQPLKRKVEIKVDPKPKKVINIRTKPKSGSIPSEITNDFIISKKLREGDPTMNTALFAAAGDFAYEKLKDDLWGMIPYGPAQNIKSTLKEAFGGDGGKSDIEKFNETVLEIYVDKHSLYDSVEDIKEHYRRLREVQKGDQKTVTEEKPEPEQPVYFKFDSTEFNEDLTSDRNWQHIVSQVNAYINNITIHGEGTPTIKINGYASPVGQESYNDKLAEQRAKTIKEKLDTDLQNRSEYKIKAIGKGEAK